MKASEARTGEAAISFDKRFDEDIVAVDGLTPSSSADETWSGESAGVYREGGRAQLL